MTYRFHFAATPALATRNKEIFELHERGHSCAAIARLLNMSHARVWQIVWNGKVFSTQTEREALNA